MHTEYEKTADYQLVSTLFSLAPLYANKIKEWAKEYGTSRIFVRLTDVNAFGIYAANGPQKGFLITATPHLPTLDHADSFLSDLLKLLGSNVRSVEVYEIMNDQNQSISVLV